MGAIRRETHFSLDKIRMMRQTLTKDEQERYEKYKNDPEALKEAAAAEEAGAQAKKDDAGGDSEVEIIEQKKGVFLLFVLYLL